MTQSISKFQLIDWIKTTIKADAVINLSYDDNITYDKDKRFHAFKINIFAANIHDVDKMSEPKSILNYTESELRRAEEVAQARLDNIFSECRRRKHVD